MEPRIKVLYFGPAPGITGTSAEIVTACDTVSLRSKLLGKYPRLGGLPFVLALNCRILKEESSLKDNDTVAVLPPFEGG
jgi:molybdopterin synthase sulfur carrier subunit